MTNIKELYLGIPEMTNEEYREKLQELFNGVENNTVLRYFYTMCYKLEKDWRVSPERR